MKPYLLCLLLTCLLSLQTGAQNITVTGTVRNAKGAPLTQATIAVKGTATSAITTSTGSFTISVPSANAVLLISHVGFTSREISLNRRTTIDILLQENTTDLDEVVVQAYGTTTRRLTTGSIGRVTAAEIEKQPVSNPMAALQGRVPGVVITQTSGVPGSEFRVEIRGRSSLDLTLSRNDPLYVIDGVPFEPGNLKVNQISNAATSPTNSQQGGLSPLNSINPADIESIEVLKDADATAIYGSRGANGVILITTKRGKPGKTRFQLTSSAGLSRITRSMDMLNTQQYVQMRREAFANDGTTITSTNAPDLLLWDTSRYTDLRKLLIWP